MQQIQFQIVEKYDIYTSIKCVKCGRVKHDLIIDDDVIQVLNEYCHGCQSEGVLRVK